MALLCHSAPRPSLSLSLSLTHSSAYYSPPPSTPARCSASPKSQCASVRSAHAAAPISAVALCRPRPVRKQAAAAAAFGVSLYPMADKAAAAGGAGVGVGVGGGSSGNGGGAAGRGLSVIAAAAVSSDSPMPNLFDGSTRLYFDPACPYAQRTLIAIKHKDEQTRAAADEIMQLSLEWIKAGYLTLSDRYDGGTADDVEKEFGPTLDKVEQQLQHSQGDGPFVLGSELSYVDIALLPFLERFDNAFRIFTGFYMSGSNTRPRLARWLKACYELQSYRETTLGEEYIRGVYKFLLDQGYFKRVLGMTADSTAQAS